MPLERSLSLAITALWSFLFPGTDTPSIRNSPSSPMFGMEKNGLEDTVPSVLTFTSP